MPVTGPLISSAIKLQMTARRIIGRDAGSLADSIGSAVATHITTPNMVTCTLNGTAGPVGSVSSIAVAGIVGKSMSSMMLIKSQTKRFTGRDIITIFDTISSGISQVLMGSVLTGMCAGCAVGVGTGKFIGLNEKLLSSLIVLNTTAKSIIGRNMLDLADCISFGVVNHLRSSAIFSVVVSGAVAPTPPTGPVAVVGIPTVMTKVS